MCNLGGYQIITTVASKIGGPAALVIGLVGAGILIGVGTTELFHICADNCNHSKSNVNITKMNSTANKGDHHEQKSLLNK